MKVSRCNKSDEHSYLKNTAFSSSKTGSCSLNREAVDSGNQDNDQRSKVKQIDGISKQIMEEFKRKYPPL